MNKPKAIVLMSGGLDSTVCAAIALEAGYEICALHVNYGQKTESKEYESFVSVCDHYSIQHRLIVDIDYLKKIGGSSLTDNTITISEANLESTEIPSSYVPFRNANLLSIAVSWAEVISAEFIFIGAVQEDGSGYPDCREEYFAAFQVMAQLGTKPETTITINTPLLHLNKKQIVLKGIDLNAPLQKTWSCYSSEVEACGKCDSCALRLRGFAQAGIKDPLPYKNKKAAQ